MQHSLNCQRCIKRASTRVEATIVGVLHIFHHLCPFCVAVVVDKSIALILTSRRKAAVAR